MLCLLRNFKKTCGIGCLIKFPYPRPHNLLLRYVEENFKITEKRAKYGKCKDIHRMCWKGLRERDNLCSIVRI